MLGRLMVMVVCWMSKWNDGCHLSSTKYTASSNTTYIARLLILYAIHRGASRDHRIQGWVRGLSTYWLIQIKSYYALEENLSIRYWSVMILKCADKDEQKQICQVGPWIPLTGASTWPPALNSFYWCINFSHVLNSFEWCMFDKFEFSP